MAKYKVTSEPKENQPQEEDIMAKTIEEKELRFLLDVTGRLYG
jgi:hypothetical protein